MRMCQRRWPAIGRRPRITASIGFQSLSSKIREIGSTTPLNAPASYFTQSGTNTPHGVGATVTQNASQRLPDVEPDAAGRRPGVRRARDVAQHRADRAAQCRDRLHEPAARCRDSRTAAQQSRRADRAVASDQGCVWNPATSPPPTCRRPKRGSPSAAPRCSPPKPTMQSSRAVYRQVIGLEPGKLAPAAPVDRFSPHSLPDAIGGGDRAASQRRNRAV